MLCCVECVVYSIALVACRSENGVSDLALAPCNTGGHYQRHLSLALGETKFVEEQIYWAHIPCCVKNSQGVRARTLVKHPFLLPFEIASDDVQKGGTLYYRDSAWNEVDIVKQSEVFRAHGDRAVLCRLYTDGVPIGGKARTQTRSVVVWYWNVLGENRSASSRHVITVMDSKFFCHEGCGCRGRCSLDAILAVVNWSIAVWRTGRRPVVGHTGLPLDSRRLERARAEPNLSCFGDFVQFGADLKEFNKALGLKAMNSLTTPCCLCNATQENMYNFGKFHAPRSMAALSN